MRDFIERLVEDYNKAALKVAIDENVPDTEYLDGYYEGVYHTIRGYLQDIVDSIDGAQLKCTIVKSTVGTGESKITVKHKKVSVLFDDEEGEG